MTDEPKITLKVKVDNIIQMISNKVTSWSNTPSNDNYPSEKLVKDSLDGKANLSHNHDDRYYTESEIVDFLNKKIDLDCEFINGWWNSTTINSLKGKSVKDLNTLRRDGKKFIYKVPDFSDMGDDRELYLSLETSNSTYGVVGKLYYNENTIYVRDAKTLFMNKYLLIEHIQDGTFDKYYVLDIFNIFHNHNDVYYTKSEIDNKIITDISGLTDNQRLLFSGSYNDLTNKPTIPSNTSDLNNDSGFITDSQVINDDICNYKTLISLIDENEQISDVSFENYDFDIMFTINPKENDCQGSIEIGDPFSCIHIEYSKHGIQIQTPSYDEWNILLNMDSENIIKIKQDQSTNDLTITVNDYEVISTGNSEITKNIIDIVASVGTISNFGVKICTQIITKENFKQELYTDLYDVMNCINVNFNNLDNIYLLDTVFDISNYNGLPSKNSSVVNDILRNNAVSGISLNKEFTPSTKYTLEFDYYTSVSNRNGFYFGADPSLEDGVSINNSDDGLQVVVDISNTYVETFNGTSSPTRVYTHTSNLFTSGTHHIRIVRNNTNVVFYIDNVELYTYANAKYNTIGLNKWGDGYNTISNIEMEIGG